MKSRKSVLVCAIVLIVELLALAFTMGEIRGRGECDVLPRVETPSRVVIIGPSGRPADETDVIVLRALLAAGTE